MREFLRWCDELGIRVVTIYLLSADNLTNRDTEELTQLVEIIRDLADDLSRAADWRIQHVGTTDGLPAPLVAMLRGAEARKSDSCDNSFELHLDVFDPGMNNQDRGNQDEEGPSLSQPVPRGETQVKCPFCSISILPVQAASPTYLAEI